jgi:Flp pilus assembly protein TadD
LSERQGDENQARKIYSDYIATHPTNPLPYHRLGVMAARNSRLDEAEHYLRKAVEVAPPSVDLLSDLGYLCYLQSKFDEAERYLQAALEQSPDNASATNNLALVYGARGDFEKSLRYFRRVNEDAKSHANVAYAMTQQGKLEDARLEYLHALTLDKTLRSAANALVQIETKRKAAEQAAKRNGRMPEGDAARDAVIELSSTSAEPRTSPAPRRPQPAASEMAFEPVARPLATGEQTKATYQPQPVAAAPDAQHRISTSPPTAARPNTNDAHAAAIADRLMPLPVLPTEQRPTPRPEQIAESPVAFTPVAQATRQPAPTATFGSTIDQNHTAANYSRFTASPAQQPSPNTSSPDTVPPPAEKPVMASENLANVFAQARQVSWDTHNLPLPAAAPRDQRPIPVAEPTDKIRNAVAFEAAQPKTANVQQAVHIGLSDVEAVAPKKEAAPVKAQFSDFGTAPARLNSTATAAPLQSQR